MMDPVSLAIVAAISAGISSGVGRVGQDMVIDAYQGLKALLKQKFGQESAVAKSVEALEQKPTSEARIHVLEEEIIESAAKDDPDILDSAQTLLNYLKAIPGSETHLQQAMGRYIAQADRGGHAEVRVNQQD